MSYCHVIAAMPAERAALHRAYHDHQHGFPLDDDDELFERLILEINQAGLSWETILRKQAGFRKAYSGFRVAAVAAYGEADRARLLADASIVRHRQKIDAAIANAQTVLRLQAEHGSFLAWLEAEHPKPREAWVKLFKKTFRFTGGEIVNEFLVSTGFLPGAHAADCPIAARVLKKQPRWSLTA
jgi:DNA-3-methyladenine glycosylase I